MCLPTSDRLFWRWPSFLAASRCRKINSCVSSDQLTGLPVRWTFCETRLTGAIRLM